MAGTEMPSGAEMELDAGQWTDDDSPSVRSGSYRFWGMSCPDVTSVDWVDMSLVSEN